ncbi:MAG: hypothetical protein PHW73_00995 [Atribacterota bacterium]|nr:hypothetical protein [Atribacterota bacterium]
MFVGGDLIEISYKHPTLGSGTWFPKAGEDGTFDPGGYRAEDDANATTGDGQMIDKINRVRWSVEAVVAWDMAVNDELDQARKLSESPVLADFTITHISGVIWGGKGKPVGDIQGNSNSAQMSIKLAGGGRLTKIS